MNFGCYGNIVSIDLQWEKQTLRDLLLSYCRYFDKSFTEMFVEWSSTKDDFIVVKKVYPKLSFSEAV